MHSEQQKLYSKHQSMSHKYENLKTDQSLGRRKMALKNMGL